MKSPSPWLLFLFGSLAFFARGTANSQAAAPTPSDGGAFNVRDYGAVGRYVRDLELADIRMSFAQEDLRPAIVCVDADGLELDNVKARLADGVSAAKFDGVKRLVVRNFPALENERP